MEGKTISESHSLMNLFCIASSRAWCAFSACMAVEHSLANMVRIRCSPEPAIIQTKPIFNNQYLFLFDKNNILHNLIHLSKSTEMFHCLHHSACLCLWRFKLSYWIATDVYLHIKWEVLFLHLHMKLRYIFQSQQCESLSTVTFDQCNASLQNKITPNIEWHCIHLNRIYSK